VMGEIRSSAEPAGRLDMPGPFERRRLLRLEFQSDALAKAKGLIAVAGANMINAKAQRWSAVLILKTCSPAQK
jgi:hypothetical protein